MKTTATPNLGVVVAVRGSVVDVRFEGHLPPIYSVLRAGDEAQIVIEVLAQRDARCVRGIALTSTQGLARGMVVEDTGRPLEAAVRCECPASNHEHDKRDGRRMSPRRQLGQGRRGA